MRIIIEDVTDQFARELIELAAAQGLPVTMTAPAWTAGRAEALLRDLPDAAFEIVRMTVEGGGWADAGQLRGDDDQALTGKTGSIKVAVKRGVRTGRLPDGLPVPVLALYDPNSTSYQRTKGFTMREEDLPAFREAFRRITSEA